MEVEGRHLCIGCMSELNSDGLCSSCGLIQKDYAPIPRCLVPGTILENRYYLGKVIGEGAFGITYIGWDSRLAIPVAVKEYYPSDLVSRDMVRGANPNVYFYEKEGQETYQQQLKQFLDEARNLSRFNQVNGIVSVRDFFYANNTAYIVMDYIEGCSLKSFVKENGPFSGAKTLQLIKPVMEALSKVHAIGLIHRDISPDNILINEKGELILVDFGAARMRNSELTRSMTVVFKRGYSPEEQYRARGKQGPATDVYSICATMYFMLTGKAPEEAIQRLLEDKTVPLKQFSTGLSSVQIDAITKGMEVQAKDRYPSLQDLMQDLYENEIGMAVGAKRNVNFVVLIAVMISIIAVLVGIIYFGQQAGDSQKLDIENKEVQTSSKDSDKDVSLDEATDSDIDNKTDDKTNNEAKEDATSEQYSTTQAEDITMISLVGATKKEAQEKLDGISNVTFDVTWKKEYSNEVKKGCVISQSIAAGTVMKSNQSIVLEVVVSKGEKVTTKATTTQAPPKTSQPKKDLFDGALD